MSRNLEHYQKQYAAQPFEPYQVAFRKRKLQEVLSHYNHSKLLEVGCGLESIFVSLQSFKELTVVEPSLTFYEKALNDRECFPGKENVRIIQATLEDACEKLKPEAYDFILVSSLLHEVSDPNAILTSLRQIARPHTVVHINVPNAKSFHRLLAVEMGLIRSEFEKSPANIKFQQQSVFDLDALRGLVTKNGFVVIESGSYCFKPFTHGQMQKLLDTGLFDESFLEGFYKMEKYLPGLGSEIYLNVKLV